MARREEEDSGPVLDALPDFSTPERNSRKELEERLLREESWKNLKGSEWDIFKQLIHERISIAHEYLWLIKNNLRRR